MFILRHSELNAILNYSGPGRELVGAKVYCNIVSLDAISDKGPIISVESGN